MPSFRRKPESSFVGHELGLGVRRDDDVCMKSCFGITMRDHRGVRPRQPAWRLPEKNPNHSDEPAMKPKTTPPAPRMKPRRRNLEEKKPPRPAPAETRVDVEKDTSRDVIRHAEEDVTHGLQDTERRGVPSNVPGPGSVLGSTEDDAASAPARESNRKSRQGR
jgi:hypothetical protein